VHELGHNSVFKTRALNGFFLRVLSFLGWLHPDMFFSSHLRHHRFTQNAPHDLENPYPLHVLDWGDVLRRGLVNVEGAWEALTQTARAAFGVYPTGHLGWLPEWEDTCYPPAESGAAADAAKAARARAPALAWARLGYGRQLVAACDDAIKRRGAEPLFQGKGRLLGPLPLLLFLPGLQNGPGLLQPFLGTLAGTQFILLDTHLIPGHRKVVAGGPVIGIAHDREDEVASRFLRHVVIMVTSMPASIEVLPQPMVH
jgi:hypothetical protein